MSPREVYRKLMRNRRKDAIVNWSLRTIVTTTAPVAPFLKSIDFVWYLGPTSDNMGPNSQATAEATNVQTICNSNENETVNNYRF